jgi:uncharacterized protein (DUF488 family)
VLYVKFNVGHYPGVKSTITLFKLLYRYSNKKPYLLNNIFLYNGCSMEKAIYTIGHSNHGLETFLTLLRNHGIQVVVDVRSAPYSRYVLHFNKLEIEHVLTADGLKYIFMGDVIGGKPSGSYFTNTAGTVDYKKLAAAESFQQGLDRLIKGMNDGWIIALMCAEEDPSKCHRHHLIARALEMKRGVDVIHIRADSTKIRAKKLLEDSSAQLNLFLH